MELQPLVDRYLQERSEGAVEAQLLKVAGQLDALYWTAAGDLASRAAHESADRLVFDKDARLRMDLGLLDWRLLEGGEKNRPVLLRELYAPSPHNHLYFSEWLAQRFRSFVLMARLGGGDAKKGDTQVHRAARARLYATIRPFFRNLPGFNPQAIELFLSCRLDETIDALARKEEERFAEQRKQLLAIRTQMVARARERAQSEDDLALFDALAKLDKMSPASSAPIVEARAVPLEDRIDFVAGELKLVRSLLRLGIAGSGLTKTHSVLVSLDARLTKAQLAPLVDAVREADAGLPASPAIVIAPYVGTGFYEWDRDTVFVPLRSTRSAEDSVVTALANFRLMLDALQENGGLKKAAKGGADFRETFLRDYKAWVLGVGKGFKGALDPAAYAFFKARIGPRPEHLFAPKEWVALTPDERQRTVQECRIRINRAEAGFEERYRLAIIYHREERRTEALEQVSEAVRLNPVDGRALLSKGYLLAQFGSQGPARSAFEEVQEICPNSIWSVYASDELSRLA